MAETVGFAILSAVAVEGASAATATVVGSIAITAATVAASYALQSLTATQAKREAAQATLNQSMGTRRRIYGKTLVGGTRAFWDARDGEMHQAIVIAAHEIDGIAEYWVGDTRVTTDGGEAGGNVLDYPMINKVFFERYLGTAGQAAATIGLARYPDSWTADHRLAGLAYVWVVFGGTKKADTQTVFPQGANTVIRFTVRGAKIWDVSVGGQDPENPSTWVWGDNSADCILDYLRHADGMRRPLSQCDIPSFQDFHATCAESVARADGSIEGRYRLWGTYEFNEEPKDVLARMCATCDATLVQGRSGKIGIRGGKYSGPLITIPTANIVTASLTQGNDKLDAFNKLKVSYTEPDAYFQPTELQARDDLASQAQIGVIEAQRDLVMVPSFSQAARLAKIMMAKENPVWKGTLGTHLVALDAINDPTVQITFQPVPDSEPLMNAACEFTALSLRGDASGCDIGFRSIPASAYDWNPATEEPPKPVTPAAIDALQQIDDPTGVDATVERPDISGGTQAVRILLSWDPATRDDTRPEAQYALAGSDDWQPMAVAADELSALTPYLADGGSYDLRVRHAIGFYGSDWVEVGPIDAISDTTPPGPPTGFVANGGSGNAMLAWTAPNSANMGSVRAYRAASGAGFGAATVIATILLGPNQAFDMTNSPLGAGSYDFWVRALNRAGFGDASSTAGPMTASVT